MRKIVMINWVSIDGFFAGPDGELDWIVRDPEVDAALRQPAPGDPAPESQGAGTMLLGNTTYTLFENSWPPIADDPNAPEALHKMAEEVTRMTKIVFSRTRQDVTWENSRLFRGNLIEELNRLKHEAGTPILIFGSGTIVQQLSRERLIDEYLIAITPVILGNGKALFRDVDRLSLRLVDVRHFNSGNVLLRYR